MFSCLPSLAPASLLASQPSCSNSNSNSNHSPFSSSPPSPYSPLHSRSSLSSRSSHDDRHSIDSFHSSPTSLLHSPSTTPSSPTNSLARSSPTPSPTPTPTHPSIQMKSSRRALKFAAHNPQPVLWLHRLQSSPFRPQDLSDDHLPLSPPSEPNSLPQPLQASQILPNSPDSHRPRAIAELVDTEAIYAADLAVVRDIYLARAQANPPAPPPLSLEDRKTIFGNIDQLALLADTFADKLKLAADANQVGGCFLAFLGAIERQFMTYCARYSSSIKRLHEFEALVSKNKAFKSPSKALRSSSNSNSSNGSGGSGSGASNTTRGQHVGLRYLRECQALSVGRTHAWDLGSLLIKPVQRCLKYPLLLDQIIRFTAPSDSDYSALVAARDGMVAVADAINETKRRAELVGAIVGPQPRYTIRRRRGSSGLWPLGGELGRLVARTRGAAGALAVLPVRLRVSAEALGEWVRAADALADGFRNVYLLKTGSSGGGEPTKCGADRVLSRVERVQRKGLRVACNGPLQHLHTRLEREIIPYLDLILKLYERPLMIIERLERGRDPDGRLERVLQEELPRLERSARKAVQGVVGRWAGVVGEVQREVAELVRGPRLGRQNVEQINQA